MSIIMHIDVNSAFLSWTAREMLRRGNKTDIRDIASVIGGDPKERHGIVLAKSVLAKKYGIKTGESLFEARRKCPQLEVFPPDKELYSRCSEEMYNLLYEYSPIIERFSIDECFLDYTQSQNIFGDPVEVAYKIKEHIKTELGFTVNIGVSVNKILAKMGSELEKPDKVHTLFPHEIEEKIWALPVGELFMVGKKAERKLQSVNINTIGDLAKMPLVQARAMLKAQGETIWNYANGIDSSPVVKEKDSKQKEIGNSITISHDILDIEEGKKILLGLSEKVGGRLRETKEKAGVISISITTGDFEKYTRQSVLSQPVDSTIDIYKMAVILLEKFWTGRAIRLLGVSVSGLSSGEEEQITIESLMFENNHSSIKNNSQLDKTLDTIREKYGKDIISRGALLNRK